MWTGHCTICPQYDGNLRVSLGEVTTDLCSLKFSPDGPPREDGKKYTKAQRDEKQIRLKVSKTEGQLNIFCGE